MTLTLDLPPDLEARVKSEAARRGVSQRVRDQIREDDGNAFRIGEDLVLVRGQHRA